MDNSNRPLTSREFKIMLRTDHFIDREKGMKEVSSIIEDISGRQGGKYEAPNSYDEVERRTWFLDTDDCELYCKKKFLFRIRKEKKSGKYEVTLKCRHSDRYVCALYDLSVSEDAETKFKDDLKTKFEEDIITGKMTDGSVTSISKFSHSATFEYTHIPEFKKIKDLSSIFPDLKLGGIDSDEPLAKVNNFEAIEISAEIGEITFSDDDTKVVPELNLWYSPAEENKPLIIEFTFKYKAKHVLGASKFYEELQKRTSIVDLDTTKTKTDYVYKGKCKP